MSEIDLERIWFITGTTKKPSSRYNAAPFIQVDFINVGTGEHKWTYTGDSYENYEHWLPILEAIKTQGVIVDFTPLKFVRKNPNIINADCRPRILGKGDYGAMLEEIENAHKPQAKEDEIIKTGNELFDNLFEIKK